MKWNKDLYYNKIGLGLNLTKSVISKAVIEVIAVIAACLIYFLS